MEEPKISSDADETNSLHSEHAMHRRERSKIAFPYGDLEGAIEVVKALDKHGGMGEINQLAAWMEHKTVDSGTFRVKLYSSRSFGLIEIKDNRISLTDLGNEIVRADTEPQARARAFLCVPLYRAIYEKYKGRLLPGDAVLEADMAELGVAEKQKGRARQGFQRSAEQAKLGKDRLVLPGGVSLDSTPSQSEKGRKMDTTNHAQAQPNTDLNPALLALFDMLPPAGSAWSVEKREEWLRFAAMMFNRLYKDKLE